MILILTNKVDTHTDEVIKLLTKRNVRVFRLNTEDLLFKYKINFRVNEDGSWQAEIIDGFERVLDLTKQKIAWLRKPDFNFFGNHPDKSAEESFAESETKAFINSIYSLSNIKWINPPFTTNGAKVKFQQLLLANRMGIKTPKTIITNQPELAKDFFVSCGEEVLLKSIYTSTVTINGLNQAISSKKISKEQFYSSYQNIAFCPTQLQEYVEKAFELRITIIGEKVFAVKIDSQIHEETKVDWRLHTKLNPHSVFDLPENIEKFCIDFLREQELVYGAMDFIVTPQGEYYFLENNPFGQYLWLEIETGIPLTETMCNLLLGYLN